MVVELAWWRDSNFCSSGGPSFEPGGWGSSRHSAGHAGCAVPSGGRSGEGKSAASSKVTGGAAIRITCFRRYSFGLRALTAGSESLRIGGTIKPYVTAPAGVMV